MNTENVYVESEKSFKKRRFKYIPVSIIPEVFLIIFALAFLHMKNKTTVEYMYTFMAIASTILLGILISQRMIRGVKMTNFQISNDGILDSSNKKGNWVDFSRISIIKYSLPMCSMVLSRFEYK